MTMTDACMHAQAARSVLMIASRACSCYHYCDFTIDCTHVGTHTVMTEVYRYRMIRFAVGLCCLVRTSSFTIGPWRQSPLQRSSCLSALTERQMQFWEDVDEGLVDIEQVYVSRGEDIDRIRTFGKR